MPADLFQKMKGLTQDLNFTNFNLLGLKTLVFNGLVVTAASGATPAINWGLGAKQKMTLTANATPTFTAPSGVANLLLMLVQDATGSRTVTWPASVKWVGAAAPTLTTTATTGTDIVTFLYDGTNYWGTYSLNFA